MLITAIVETIDKRKLTQKDAAHRCHTDQPTLSKVLRGRMESVTIDRLTAWLTALGRTVEIHVRPYDAKQKPGIWSPRLSGSSGSFAGGQGAPVIRTLLHAKLLDDVVDEPDFVASDERGGTLSVK